MIRRAFALLPLFLIAAGALRAADFAGRWEGRPTVPDGTEVKVVFDFVASEGRWAGSVETDQFGTFTADDVVVEGDKITFNVLTDGGIYYNSGTLTAEGLLVEGRGPDGPIDPVLYRRPPRTRP